MKRPESNSRLKLTFSFSVVRSLICRAIFCFFATSHLYASLIVNGDFESGNSAFSSQYAYVPGIQPFPGLNGGEFNIVTNPSPYHFAAASYGDHTSGSGKMMMVNADRNDVPNLTVWSQNLNVAQNTTYAFSAWISTWVIAGDLNISRIEVLVNGSSIGKKNSANVVGVWEQFSACWHSGGNATANIQIYEVGHEIGFPGGGNDFALDDLSFRAISTEVPEPTSIAIFSLAIGYLGFIKRLRVQHNKSCIV